MRTLFVFNTIWASVIIALNDASHLISIDGHDRHGSNDLVCICNLDVVALPTGLRSIHISRRARASLHPPIHAVDLELQPEPLLPASADGHGRKSGPCCRMHRR